MFIGICSRSQVSIYRTIGPVVFFFEKKKQNFKQSRDTAFCGITSGAKLFMYVPQNGHQWVNLLFNFSHAYCYYQKNSILIFAPAHWSLGEIDGLLVPPGKASKLLTNDLITG